MTNLKKLNRKSASPPPSPPLPHTPFKKTCLCTILPPFFNFSNFPLWWRYLKFTLPPPFKKGGVQTMNSTPHRSTTFSSQNSLSLHDKSFFLNAPDIKSKPNKRIQKPQLNCFCSRKKGGTNPRWTFSFLQKASSTFVEQNKGCQRYVLSLILLRYNFVILLVKDKK